MYSRCFVKLSRSLTRTSENPLLPDLARVASFLLQSIGELALDELDGLFDGHIDVHGHQQMNMIGHHNEVVYVESLCGDV